MQFSKTEKANTRRGKSAIAVRTSAIASALLLGLFAFVLRQQREEKPILTDGIVVGTRIVPDHAIETKQGGRLSWRAEYRVTYSAAGRDFTVWADSGLRGDTENDVRISLPQSRRSCQVRYDPAKSESAMADCR